MKLKLDENLPRQLVPILTSLGRDVDTVPDEDLAGQDDHAVWATAQSAGRFLVTQDLDFTEAVDTWEGCLVSATPTKVRVRRAD